MMTKTSESITSKRSKGGRLVGTTVKAKEEQKINTLKAKNEIAKRFLTSAIRQRFYRKREVCHHVAGQISPLERIESSVIAIVVHIWLEFGRVFVHLKG